MLILVSCMYVRVWVASQILYSCMQLRVLHNDFARYNLTDDESDELDHDNYGWKIISTDVFRFPPHKSLLCAIIGVCVTVL